MEALAKTNAAPAQCLAMFVADEAPDSLRLEDRFKITNAGEVFVRIHFAHGS
jgi:hypothetical protein